MVVSPQGMGAVASVQSYGIILGAMSERAIGQFTVYERAKLHCAVVDSTH